MLTLVPNIAMGTLGPAGAPRFLPRSTPARSCSTSSQGYAASRLEGTFAGGRQWVVQGRAADTFRSCWRIIWVGKVGRAGC